MITEQEAKEMMSICGLHEFYQDSVLKKWKEDKLIFTEKDNLCDFCKNEFPTCTPEKIEFGIGKGYDNVKKCTDFRR